MELRAFYAIFRRRWLLVLIPPLVVALFSAVTYQSPPAPGYNVGVNFLVAQPPTPSADLADQERYYNWLSSEYIVNGLTDWAVSGSFKTAVSNQLAQEGLEVPPGSFSVAVAAAIGNCHSLPVTFQYSSTWPSRWRSWRPVR